MSARAVGVQPSWGPNQFKSRRVL